MADECGGKCLPDRPDVGELRDRIATEMTARLFDGAPIIPGSNEDVVAFLMAGVAYQMHGVVNSAFRETDPRCMCCDRLVEWAARRGINVRPARAAVGFVKLTGDAGAAIPDPLGMTAGTVDYQTDALFQGQPVALDEHGEAVVRVVAQDVGPDGNRKAGETLILTGAPAGIDSDATVLASGIVGGTDDEDCEALRARVIRRLKSGAVAPNAEWIMEQIRTWPGITRVCVSSCPCCSSPSFYAFMDGTYGDVETEPYGVPPAEVLREIEDAIFGNPQGAGLGIAPIGARGRMPCARPQLVDITIHGLQPRHQQIVEAVRLALAEVFKTGICPGGSMCLRLLDDAVMSVTGVKCFSRVEVHATGHAQIDGDSMFMDCDYFPVMGNVAVL